MNIVIMLLNIFQSSNALKLFSNKFLTRYTIFLYKNDLSDNQSRGGDIFVSKVINNKWKTPEPLGKPINTSYWEGGACISPDGKTLFFISERKGGYGRADIWMVKRKNKQEQFKNS